MVIILMLINFLFLNLRMAFIELGKNPTLRAFFGRSSYKVKAGEVTYVLEKCVSEVRIQTILL